MDNMDKKQPKMLNCKIELVYDLGYDESELFFIAQIAVSLALKEGYISKISGGDVIEVKFHDGPYGNITLSCNEQTAELESVRFIGGAPLVRKRQTTT